MNTAIHFLALVPLAPDPDIRLKKEIDELIQKLGHRDYKLREQLADSSDAVPSLIADGFPQSTDRYFAQFLYRAKGESSETRTHLRVSMGRDYITEQELLDLCDRYNEIEKMLTGLIRHLERENRRHRGS